MVRDRFDWGNVRRRCLRFRFAHDKRAEGRAILAELKRMLAEATGKPRERL